MAGIAPNALTKSAEKVDSDMGSTGILNRVQVLIHHAAPLFDELALFIGIGFKADLTGQLKRLISVLISHISPGRFVTKCATEQNLPQ
jgi:hypothetical protein